MRQITPFEMDPNAQTSRALCWHSYMVDHFTVHSNIPRLHGQVRSRKTPFDLDCIDHILCNTIFQTSTVRVRFSSTLFPAVTCEYHTKGPLIYANPSAMRYQQENNLSSPGESVLTSKPRSVIEWDFAIGIIYDLTRATWFNM